MKPLFESYPEKYREWLFGHSALGGYSLPKEFSEAVERMFKFYMDMAISETQGIERMRKITPPEGKVACQECDGKGWVKCEHQEYGDHNDCLECGYDRTPDLADEMDYKAEAAHDRQHQRN